MKTVLCRWHPILVTLALLLAAAMPAQAARFRRVVPVRMQTFQVASNAVIAVGTEHHASLANLHPGDHVVLGYRMENGALVAHRVADGVPHHLYSPKEGSPALKAHHAQKAESLAHIHGVVRWVNVQARTVTLVYKHQQLR